MNRILLLLIVIFLTIRLDGQDPGGDYNPYVSAATITPEPLFPLEADGSGVFSFTLGNSGGDQLEVFPGESITVIITLSNGVPDNSNPLLAIGGSYANLFSWSYTTGEFIGTQMATISGGASGRITIN
jgi:hypothetical protein